MSRPAPDLDGDGVPDAADDDIDGDGFTNERELDKGSDPSDPSSTPRSRRRK